MTRHALLTYAAKHWSRTQLRALGWVVWGEALLRQGLSLIRGHGDAAVHFARLRAVSADLVRGRSVRARSRLLRSADALRRIT
jgi:hypothetical protein